jgi:hypothetical protein
MARRFWSSVALLSIALSSPAQRGVPAEGLQLSAASLETFNGCGMEGDATKTRHEGPEPAEEPLHGPGRGEVNTAVTLAAILAPDNDVGRWKVRYEVEIVGYVCDVKPGPVESVNCGARRVADRDTHIELVLDPMDSSAARRVIVESPLAGGPSWPLGEGTGQRGLCPSISWADG